MGFWATCRIILGRLQDFFRHYPLVPAGYVRGFCSCEGPMQTTFVADVCAYIRLRYQHAYYVLYPYSRLPSWTIGEANACEGDAYPSLPPVNPILVAMFGVAVKIPTMVFYSHADHLDRPSYAYATSHPLLRSLQPKTAITPRRYDDAKGHHWQTYALISERCSHRGANLRYRLYAHLLPAVTLKKLKLWRDAKACGRSEAELTQFLDRHQCRLIRKISPMCLIHGCGSSPVYA